MFSDEAIKYAPFISVRAFSVLVPKLVYVVNAYAMAQLHRETYPRYKNILVFQKGRARRAVSSCRRVERATA